MSALKKTDLTFSSIPTATYKWGVMPLASDCGVILRHVKWFRTRKAADLWGSNVMPGYAIARLYKLPSGKTVS